MLPEATMKTLDIQSYLFTTLDIQSHPEEDHFLIRIVKTQN